MTISSLDVGALILPPSVLEETSRWSGSPSEAVPHTGGAELFELFRKEQEQRPLYRESSLDAFRCFATGECKGILTFALPNGEEMSAEVSYAFAPHDKVYIAWSNADALEERLLVLTNGLSHLEGIYFRDMQPLYYGEDLFFLEGTPCESIP